MNENILGSPRTETIMAGLDHTLGLVEVAPVVTARIDHTHGLVVTGNSGGQERRAPLEIPRRTGEQDARERARLVPALREPPGIHPGAGRRTGVSPAPLGRGTGVVHVNISP